MSGEGDIVERLRSQHGDLRQGAYYSQWEDPAWDATADAADAIEARDAEIDQLRGWHSEMFQYAADRDAEIERLRAKPGDRIVDGGRMGTIVTCPTCDGDGILHDPDEKPEPSIPEGGQP